MKDNNNEGRKTRNWKRMARQVGCSVILKKDTSNATLDKGSVLAECMQYIREKRKGDTELLSGIQTKKNQIVVEREANPKWLPSPQ